MRKKIISVTAAALALVMLISGCAAGDKINEFFGEEVIEPVGIEREERKEVSNSLSVGTFGFDTYNPLMTSSQTVKECMQFVYEPLFDVDEKLRPIPVLADSYTVSPDGRTIDITLKQGVTWHDGSELTAYDAAYTIKQIRSGITTYTDNLANLADYKATAANTLRLVLNYSVPNFVSLLTFPIVKQQSEMTVNPNYSPIGTGAFAFGGQVSAGKVLLTAYDGYRGGRAQLDAIYVFDTPDIDRYESMFEASEIDMITGNTVDLSEYTPLGSVESHEYITNKLTYAGFNTRRGIFAGSNTRRGLGELIDKESIINSTIYSRGVAVDVPINPASVYYYDTNTKFKRNETRALELLGDDGWGSNADGEYIRTVNGSKQKLTFELLVEEENSERVAIAEKIATDFTDFGIPVKVNAVSADKFYSKIRDLDYDMLIGEYDIAPNLDLTPLISSAGNFFGFANSDLDTLAGQMGMTQDEQQLMELFKQYGAKAAEEMPFCPLFYRKGDVLCGSKLKTEIVPSVTRCYRNTASWSVK